MSNIPIYIPTLISDINYNPAKVYPRLYFYNGPVECEPYWIEYKPTSGSTSVTQTELSLFPYVDHYNVVTGSFPSQGSKSLLFQNENPVYGATPTSSLYSDYWSTYINLLYDPKTRLINCKGIIPLADYYKMELNDIVEWRGNTFHLRAINNYDLKTGKCDLQLLGPIIRDTTGIEYDCDFSFSSQTYSTTTTTSTTTAAPTTTTTTTLAPGCPDCVSYERRLQTAGSGTAIWEYTDCLDGTTKQVSISSQVYRTFGSRTAPVYVSGPATVGATQETLPYGTGCGPFDFCRYQKYRIVTKNATPPGFIYYSYYSTASCAVVTDIVTSDSSSYDVTVVEGSMTFGASTTDVNQFTIIASGSASTCCNTTTTTTTAAPTTTTTTIGPGPYYYFIRRFTCPGCSGGNTSIGISYTPLTIGQFYGYPGDTECYEIVSVTSSTGWSVDLTYMTGFNSCATYCSA